MEMKAMIRGLITAGLAASVLQAAESITITWAKWDPANFLEKLSQDFTKETGIGVKVNQIPWENFEQSAFTNLTSKSDKWDILIGDSQWLGRCSKEGHYADLTDWVTKANVDKNMTAASMEAYAEYPKGSKKYWAIPLEGDGIAFAYRKDLFEDAANMAAFKAIYKKDLAVPQSVDDLVNIAKFFADPKQRKNPPASEKFYGLAGYGATGAGTLTLVTEALIWNYGGSLGDYSTYELKGHLDNPGTIKGLEVSRELFKLYPPGFSSAFFMEVNNAYNAGIVPMQLNFMAFFPALVADGAKFAKSTGFFPFPGATGPDGKTRQFTALGGQGASLVAYSKKQEAAKKWLDWFAKEETQKKWGKVGGFTCDSRVLQSKEFLSATPYNPTFAKTMEIAKDFWAVPEFPKLMASMEENLTPYVTKGKGSPLKVAQKIMTDHQKIFQTAGYYKK